MGLQRVNQVVEVKSKILLKFFLYTIYLFKIQIKIQLKITRFRHIQSLQF